MLERPTNSCDVQKQTICNIVDPWGVYVHVPWCRRRCPYCDFYFEVGRPAPSFIELLLKEWEARSPSFPNRPAQSLYWGGGTPSLLSGNDIKQLRDRLLDEDRLSPDAEITLEANPEDIHPALAKDYLHAGVNRISLGVQSFEDTILKDLGRRHRKADVLLAIKNLVRAGFRRISVDLIVGVCGEDKNAILSGITEAVSLGVGHFSVYLLTIESNTRYEKLIEKGQRHQPDSDAQAQIYEDVRDHLKRLGFSQYEVSSHAQEGQMAIHNRIYWAKGVYLGLGPGAHSMHIQESGQVVRRRNVPDFAKWRTDPGVCPYEEEVLSKREGFYEAVMTGLRDMAYGVDLQLLGERFLIPHQPKLMSVLNVLCEEGHLQQNNGRYFLSEKGALFADRVWREIWALC